MLTFETLRKEVVPWTKKNFPKAEPHYPLLGLVEEINGELFDTTDPAAVADAIADAVIFLTHYVSLNDLSLPHHTANTSFTDLVSARSKFGDTGNWSRTIIVCIGKLSQAHLKRLQKIKLTDKEWKKVQEEQATDLLLALCSFCKASKIDMQGLIESTWMQVKKRDWKKYPKNGKSK